MRGQKGITLVALIITIIVLLILAVVSIGAISDSKITNHAKNAATDWQTGKEEEDTEIKKGENMLNDIVETLK